MNKPNHGRATHLVRSSAAPGASRRKPAQAGASRRKPAQAAPVEAYAPGHFTALIKAHDWPPAWVPHVQASDWRGDAAASRRASANRDAGQLAGQLWAAGRVDMPNTPVDQRMPGWLR